MRYKRDESFRYAFEPSISGAFHILMLNEQKVEMAEGELSILNLSPGGIRIQTQYKLPDPTTYSIKLEIRFYLENRPLCLKGSVQWVKPVAAGYEYGLELLSSDKEKEDVISEVKRFALTQRSLN
ncbi:PilZ domain-containing protein [Alkalihalobacillus sp. FSL W8-0930]